MDKVVKKGGDISLYFISTAFWPNLGGAEKRFVAYFKEFVDRGIEVTVLSGTPKASKSHFTEGDQFAGHKFEKVESGIRFVYFKLPGKGAEAREKRLFQGIREYLRAEDDINIVQLLGVHTRHAIRFVREIKNNGAKVIYTYALSQKPVLMLDRSRIFRKYLKYARVKKIVNLCDLVILQSNELREELKLKDGRHIEIIPNGVDLSRFRTPDQEEKNRVRDELNLDKQALIILTVGTISPRKRTDMIIDAWVQAARTNNNLRLIIIGRELEKKTKSYQTYVEAIHKNVAASGRNSDITLIGYRDNIADYYAAADIFVFTPVKEGMPNALLEAMASGLPCVVTGFTGLSKDFGEESSHYILAEGTSKGVSEKIIQLVEDIELRKYISFNASTLMNKTMAMNGIIDRYCDLYRRLAKAE